MCAGIQSFNVVLPHSVAGTLRSFFGPEYHSGIMLEIFQLFNAHQVKFSLFFFIFGDVSDVVVFGLIRIVDATSGSVMALSTTETWILLTVFF